MSCARPREANSSGASTDAAQLALGLLLMLLGVLLTLQAFGLASAARATAFLPAMLIVAGAWTLSRRPQSRFLPWALIVVGSWLLLRALDIVRVGFFELLWPLLIIYVGVKLGLKAMNRTPASQTRVDAGRSSHLFALLGESKRTVQDRPFTGASMTACFGSCAIDLRQATIPPGQEAVIDVFALFSSQEMIIPEGWVVVSEVVSIAAQVEDRRRYPSVPLEPTTTAPRLIIRGIQMFSHLKMRD